MERQRSDPFDGDWFVVDEWKNTSGSPRLDSSQSYSGYSSTHDSKVSTPRKRTTESRTSSLEEGEIDDDDDDPLFEGTVPLLSSSPKQQEPPRASSSSTKRSPANQSPSNRKTETRSSRKHETRSPRKSESMSSPRKRESISPRKTESMSPRKNERTPNNSVPSPVKKDVSPVTGKSDSLSSMTSDGLHGKVVITPKKVQPSKPTGVEKSIKLVLSKSSISRKKEDCSSSISLQSEKSVESVASRGEASTGMPEGLEDGEIEDSQQSKINRIDVVGAHSELSISKITRSVDEKHLSNQVLEKQAVQQAVKSVLQQEKVKLVASGHKAGENKSGSHLPGSQSGKKKLFGTLSPFKDPRGHEPVRASGGISETLMDVGLVHNTEVSIHQKGSSDLESGNSLASQTSAHQESLDSPNKILSDKVPDTVGTITIDEDLAHMGSIKELNLCKDNVGEKDTESEKSNVETVSEIKNTKEQSSKRKSRQMSKEKNIDGPKTSQDNEESQEEPIGRLCTRQKSEETDKEIELYNEALSSSDSVKESMEMEENELTDNNVTTESVEPRTSSQRPSCMEDSDTQVDTDLDIIVPEKTETGDLTVGKGKSNFPLNCKDANVNDVSDNPVTDVSSDRLIIDESATSASENVNVNSSGQNQDEGLDTISQSSKDKNTTDGKESEEANESTEIVENVPRSSVERDNSLVCCESTRRPISVESCLVCAFSTVDKEQFKEHLMKHCVFVDHNEPTTAGTLFQYKFNSLFICSACSFVTNKNSFFENHTVRHNIAESYMCMYCSTAATDTALILKHLSSCHSLQQVKFAVCHWKRGSQVINALKAGVLNELENHTLPTLSSKHSPSPVLEHPGGQDGDLLTQRSEAKSPSVNLQISSASSVSHQLGTSTSVSSETPVIVSQCKSSAVPPAPTSSKVLKFHNMTTSLPSGKASPSGLVATIVQLPRQPCPSVVGGPQLPSSLPRLQPKIMPSVSVLKSKPNQSPTHMTQQPALKNSPLLKTRLECMYQHGYFVCKSCNFRCTRDIQFGHHMFHHLHGSQNKHDGKPLYCNVCTRTTKSCLTATYYKLCPLVKQMMDLLAKQKSVEESKNVIFKAATKAGIPLQSAPGSTASKNQGNVRILNIPIPQIQVSKSLPSLVMPSQTTTCSPSIATTSNQVVLFLKQPGIVSPASIQSFIPCQTPTTPPTPIIIEPKSPGDSGLCTTVAATLPVVSTTSSVGIPLSSVSEIQSPGRELVPNESNSSDSSTQRPPGLLSPADGLIVIAPEEPDVNNGKSNQENDICQEAVLHSDSDVSKQISMTEGNTTLSMEELLPSLKNIANKSVERTPSTEETSSNSSDVSSGASKTNRTQMTSLVRCTFRQGRFVCESCNYQSGNADIFRRHLWKDVHPKRMHCNHCTPDVKFNRFKSCPIMNQLMAVLEKSKSSAETKETTTEQDEGNNGSGSDALIVSNKGTQGDPLQKTNEVRHGEHSGKSAGISPSSPINLDGDETQKNNHANVPNDDSVIEVSDASFEEGQTGKGTGKRGRSEVGEMATDNNDPQKDQVGGSTGEDFQDVIAMIKGLNDSQDMATDKQRDSQTVECPPTRDSDCNSIPGVLSVDNSYDTPTAQMDSNSRTSMVESDAASDQTEQSRDDHDPVDDLNRLMMMSESIQQTSPTTEGPPDVVTEQDVLASERASDAENEAQTVSKVGNVSSDEEEAMVIDLNCDHGSQENSSQPVIIEDKIDQGEENGPVNVSASIDLTTDDQDEPIIEIPSSPAGEDEDSQPRSDDQGMTQKQSHDTTPGEIEASHEEQVLLTSPTMELDGESVGCMRCIPRDSSRNKTSIYKPLASHTPTKKDDKKFYACAFLKCNGVAYADKTSFKLHNLTCHHNAMSFPCAYCTRNLPDSKHLIKHMKKTHTVEDSRIFRLFHCAVENCFYATNQMMDFRRHNAMIHADSEDYKCVYCNQSFAVIAELVDHLEGNLVKLIRCPVCMMTSQSKNKILDHLGDAHPNSPKKIVVTSWVSCSGKQASASQMLGQKHASGNQTKDGASATSGMINGSTEGSTRQRTPSTGQDVDDRIKYACGNCMYVTFKTTEFYQHLQTCKKLSDLIGEGGDSPTKINEPSAINKAEEDSSLISNKEDNDEEEPRSEIRRSRRKSQPSVRNWEDDQIISFLDSPNDDDQECGTAPHHEHMEEYKCADCTYVGLMKNSYEKHILLHQEAQDTNKSFTCPHCPFSAYNIDDFRIHLICHNGKQVLRIFTCSYCNLTTNQMDFIEDHISDTHEYQIKYTVEKEVLSRNCCPWCRKETGNMGLHVNEAHGRRASQKYLLEHPSKIMDSPGEKRPSISLKIRLPKPPGIEGSNQMPQTPEVISLDVAPSSASVIPPNIRFQCSFCHYNTDKSDCWFKHIKRHQNMGLFEKDMWRCRCCKWLSTYREKVLEHVMNRHPMKPAEDNVMHLAGTKGTTFDWGSFATGEHAKRDHSSRPLVSIESYHCEYCDFSCMSGTELQQHLSSHHNDLDEDVPVQDSYGEDSYHNSFSSNSSVAESASHNVSLRSPDGRANDASFQAKISTPHGLPSRVNKMFQCSLCPYATEKKVHYRRHKLNHQRFANGNEGFQCGHCKFVSIAQHCVKRHINRYHAGLPSTILSREPAPPKLDANDSSNMNSDDVRSFSTDLPPPLAPPPPRVRSHNLEQSSEAVPSLPPALERFDDLKVHIPNEMIFRVPQKCPKCEFTTKVRYNLLRHLKSHQDISVSGEDGSLSGAESLVRRNSQMSSSEADSMSVGGPGAEDTDVDDAENDRDSAGFESEITSEGSNSEDEIEPGKAISTSKTPEELAKYCFKIDGKDLFQCIKCVFMHRYPSKVHRHFSYRHEKTTLFHCPHCNFEAVESAKIRRHCQMMHEGLPVPNDDCSLSQRMENCESLLRDKRFVQQYIRKRANNIQECKLCDYQQEGSSALKRHVFAVHLEFYPFKCKYCAYSTVEINKVKRHIQKSHSDMPVKIIRKKFKGSLPVISQAQRGIGSDSPENDEEAGLREAMLPPVLSRSGDSQDSLSGEPPVLLRPDQIKEEPVSVVEATQVSSESNEAMSDIPQLRISQYCSEAVPGDHIILPSQIKDEPQDGYNYNYSEQLTSVAQDEMHMEEQHATGEHSAVGSVENQDSEMPNIKAEPETLWDQFANIASGSNADHLEQISLTDISRADSTPDRNFGSPPQLSPILSEKNTPAVVSRSGRIIRQVPARDSSPGDDNTPRRTGQKLYHCSYCGYSSRWNVKDVKHHILLTHLKKYPYMCKYCESGHRIRNMVEEHIRANHKGRTVSVRIMTNDLADQFHCVTEGMDMHCSFIGYPGSLKDNDGIQREAEDSSENLPKTATQGTPSTSRTRSNEELPLDLSTKTSPEILSPFTTSARQVDVMGDKTKRTGRWQCRVCGYISHQSTKVYIHYLGKHMHKKPYGCKYCDFQFNVRYGIVDHTKLKHPKEEVVVRENLKEHIRLLREKVVKIKGRRGIISPHLSFSQNADTSSPVPTEFETVQENMQPRSEVPEPYSDNSAVEPEYDTLGRRRWVSILKVPSVSSLKRASESDSPVSEEAAETFTGNSESPGDRDMPSEPNEDGTFACDICSFKTSTQRLLRLHRMHHFSYRPFGCGYCNFKNFYKARVRIHSAKEHKNMPFKIRRFEQPKSLGEARPVASDRVMHMVVAKRRKLYGGTGIPVRHSPNKMPSQTFVKQEGTSPGSGGQTLRALLSSGAQSAPDVETEMSDTAWKCPQCPAFLDSHMQLQHHIDVHHSDYGPYKCGYCGIVIRYKDKIISHLSQKHPGEDPLFTTASSPVPGFTGLSSSSDSDSPARKRARLDEVVEKLVVERSAAAMAADKQPQREYDADKPAEDVIYKYFCKHCSFHTYMKATMRHHVMVHVGYRPYNCPHCTYNNIKSYPVKLHVQKMHPEARGVQYIYRKDKDSEINLPNEFIAKIVDEREKEAEEKGKFQGHKIQKNYQANVESNAEDTLEISKPLGISGASGRLPPVPESLYETVTMDSSSTSTYQNPSPVSSRKGVGSPRQKIKYMCVLCGYRVDYTVTMKRHLMSETDYKPYNCPLCLYRDIQLPGVKRHGQKVHHKASINVVIKRDEDKEEMLERLLQECIIDPNAEPPPEPEVVPNMKTRKMKPPPQEKDDSSLMDISDDIPDDIPDIAPVVAKPSKMITSFGGKKVAKKSTRPFSLKLKLSKSGKRKKKAIECQPEGPMQCQYCDYSTTNRQLFLVHEVRHGPKRIQCHYCKYRCFFAGEMGKHQRRHHSSRAYRYRYLSPEELGAEQFEKHSVRPRKRCPKGGDDDVHLDETTVMEDTPEEEEEALQPSLDPEENHEKQEEEEMEDGEDDEMPESLKMEVKVDSEDEKEKLLKRQYIKPQEPVCEAGQENVTLLSVKSKVDEKVVAVIDGIEITESWLAKDPSSGFYTCQLCDYKTSNREHFKVHFIKHVPPRWQCAFCEYKNQLSYEMKKHIRKNHIGQSIDRMIELHDGTKESIRDMSNTGNVLPIMSKGHRGSTKSSWDTASVASMASVASITSAVSFASGSDISDAASVAPPPVPSIVHASLVNCGCCSFQTNKMDELLIHVQRHSRSRSGPTKIISQELGISASKTGPTTQPLPLKCGFCSFSTDFVEIFNEHTKTHQLIKPFKCGHCDYASFYRKSIMGHNTRHHNGLPVEIIDQKQPIPALHVEKSTGLTTKAKKPKTKSRKSPGKLFGVRKYRCPYCTMSSLYRYSVTKHMKTYHPELPAKINIDSKRAEPEPALNWGSAQWQPKVVLQDIAQLGLDIQDEDDASISGDI